MKKIVLLTSFLLLFLSSYTQKKEADEFEAVIRSGNSAKAFQFVRNMFGIPESKDPFLHFKERGIKQLISFYNHDDRRIEATSLIKFSQTREFWTNYSKQFTAGKWNYKTLYKTDSLAWLAANYSITLIYVHEMGHYMSYNHVHDFRDDYTCEEVVANECLGAFANAFNNNKNLAMHKQLFLSLARQTYAMIPDSNKTNFYVPMDKWCAPDPMKDFFDYFTSDEPRFLRLYGYIQFRMMEEALVNYKGGTWTGFLNNTFLNFYTAYTGAEHFKPLRYKILSKKDLNNTYGINYYTTLSKAKTGNFFRSHTLNDLKYHFDTAGQVLGSLIDDQLVNYNDTIETNNLSTHTLINWKRKDTSWSLLHEFLYRDSVSNYHSPGRSVSPDFEILSAFQHDSNFYYLVRNYNSIFTGLVLDTSFTHYELLHLREENSKYYLSSFPIPDSLYSNSRMENQELFLTGINNGSPVIVTNELTKEHDQILSIYPVSIDSSRVDPPISQGNTGKKGYFNMLYPSLYLDEAGGSLTLCFWNPVTSTIYLFKLTAAGTEGFQLYQDSFQGSYGPQMRVAGLRLAASNKLYVLAMTRKPGNTSKPVMQKLFLQW